MSIHAVFLEEPCSNDHFDRGYVLDAAVSFLDDVAVATDSVPAAVIAFGERAVTSYNPPDDMQWHEFAPTALDVCEARTDVYAVAIIRPFEDGAFIYTAHFEDGQGTIDHGFAVPEARYYTHAPQAELT